MDYNNNIFKYATSELSQDAFLCWLLSYAVDGCNANTELTKCAQELLQLFDESLNKKDLCIDKDNGIRRQVSVNVAETKGKIDILIKLKNGQEIIIEDKTFSSEHDDQLTTYKNSRKEKGISVKVVYLKTGFFYDNDLEVEADISINTRTLYDLIKKYYKQGNGEILDSYCEHLAIIIKETEDKEKNFHSKTKDEEWYLSQYHISQYVFLRELFPRKSYRNQKENEEFKIKSGNSGAKRWSQLTIKEATYNIGTIPQKYRIFWRLDKYRNDIVLSLRFYDWYDKKNNNDTEKLKAHKKEYERLQYICEGLIKGNNKNFGEWEDLKSEGKEGCCEAELFKIELSPYLQGWETKGDKFIEQIQNLTKEFIKGVEKKLE